MRRLIVVEQIERFPQLPEVRKITETTHAGPPDPAPRVAAVADTQLGRCMVAMFLGHWGLSDRYENFDDVPSALAWLLAE